MSSRDIGLLVLAVVVILVAGLVQITSNGVPSWLTTAVSGIIVYYFGVMTERNGGDNE